MTQTNTSGLVWGKFLGVSFLLATILMLAASPAHAGTTFTVNSTGDFFDRNAGDGACDFSSALGNQCSLRAAIQETNHPNNPGPDTIEFEIGGSGATGVKTIRPTAELPQITEAVIIDGFSQPGVSTNTAAVGTNAILNIQLDGSSAGDAEGLSLGSGASNSIIKGLVINRFDRNGIEITGDVTNAKVEGNFIGTDPSGTLDLGNGASFGDGVVVFGDSNTVGGTSRFQRNLISGNDGEGVDLSFGVGNEVQGNLIGTARDGGSDLGNDFLGVAVRGADRNFVGDFSSSGANTIAFNGLDGVFVGTGTGTGNRILSNSIFNNGGLGIDLQGGTENAQDATANDPGDPDGGPNDLQNKPVITSATTSGGTTTIKAKLNSTPGDAFFVQFFSSPSGNEGKKLIGSKSVTTNSDGNVNFTVVPSQAIAVGQRVTATALDVLNGNTSEFSAPRSVVAG
jgi:CSLREA domain-containing protein